MLWPVVSKASKITTFLLGCPGISYGEYQFAGLLTKAHKEWIWSSEKLWSGIDPHKNRKN